MLWESKAVEELRKRMLLLTRGSNHRYFTYTAFRVMYAKQKLAEFDGR